MRLVFLGSPEVALGPLIELATRGPTHGHQLVGVVSQPARPAGRKQTLQDPPVAQYAKAHGLPLLQPERASDPDFLQAFKAWDPDVAITAAYGQILTSAFLAIPRRATINIHPSLLPKYRGATPVPAALLQGDQETGVSILFTVLKLDAGAIICQERHPIGPEELAQDLTKRLFDQGAHLLWQSLDCLKDPTFEGIPQDPAGVTHCQKIAKADGLIDWSQPASVIHNRWRAFQPWPGSFTFLQGKRLAIVDASVAPAEPSSGPSGTMTWDKARGCLAVATGHGTFLIRRLRPAGGKDVDAASFYHGLGGRCGRLTSDGSL